MRVNSNLICCLLGVLATGAGCGAGVAAPLDIGLGLSRPETITALKRRAYCRTDEPVRTTETFRQCDGPGAQRAISWVVVEYRDRAVWRIQRLERHEGSGQAAERWHGLVAAHRKLHGPLSNLAHDRLLETRGLPAGTVSWAAWYSSDFKTLIAVYLLRVTANDGVDRPDVLEELTADRIEKDGSK